MTIVRNVKTLTLSVVAGSLALALTFAAPALAAAPKECTSATYSCTSFGYSGSDPYGYWRYGVQDTSGRWHNCTSYVAYYMYQLEGYDSRIAHFHDAITWQSEAAAKGFLVTQEPMTYDVAYFGSGHVAVVEDVVYKSNLSIDYIVTTDDNASTVMANRVTTLRVRYPGTSKWPTSFIRLYETPVYTGGGGWGPPPIPTSVTVPNN
jgi:surface antigen